MSRNSRFCFSCRLNMKAEHTNTNKPGHSGSRFSNWKRAMEAFCPPWHAGRALKAQKLMGDVIEQLKTACTAEISEGYQYVHRTVAGKRGIPLVGHDEMQSSQSQGNLFEAPQTIWLIHTTYRSLRSRRKHQQANECPRTTTRFGLATLLRVRW